MDDLDALCRAQRAFTTQGCAKGEGGGTKAVAGGSYRQESN